MESVKKEQAKSFCPEGMTPFDVHPSSESDIQRAESELNIVLPEKYKEYMLKHGGGQLLFLDVLPVVSLDGRMEDLIEANQADYREFGFVAVAPVGTGDYWGFSLDSNVCREEIYFRFHEDGITERVADDFLEFLAAIALRP